MDRISKTMLALVSGLVLTALLCLSLDASAQPAEPRPGPATPLEVQRAWTVAHRAYRLQPQLDGSTAVLEYRATDDGGHGLGPEDKPVRRVSAQHHGYVSWVQAGHTPQTLPAVKPPEKPEATVEQVAAQVRERVTAERDALLDCVAEVAAAEALGLLPAPDCRAEAVAWQAARDAAQVAVEARVVIVEAKAVEP